MKVEAGLEAAVASSTHLAEGRLPEAFGLSQAALTNSEAAFFHPSLLALLSPSSLARDPTRGLLQGILEPLR